jgi:cobalt-zinc-cadmium efflux system outer membrane protein
MLSIKTRSIYFYLSFIFLFCLTTRLEAQTRQADIPAQLTLAQAEDLLLQRNLAVASSRYQIEASRAARLIAGYKPNPVLTLGAEQIPVWGPLHDAPRFFTTNADAGAQPTYTVRLDKVIERGGKRELRAAQADFQLKTSEAQMLDTIRTQLFQLRQAFSNAILARENLAVAQGIQRQYEQTEKLTEVKLENGDLPGVELYRVRAGKLQFQQAVLQAQLTYDQSARDILNLLGARPDQLAAPLQISGSFDGRPLMQNVADLREMALAERPDVIAARNTLEAANRAVALTQAQRRRDVDISYEYQRVGSDNSAGVVFQLPLFVYNNNQAAITQAEAQRRAAEAALRQAESQAITDVEKAYRSYESSRRILDLYNSENLAQVEKLRTISTLSFNEGAASLLEVLDAQRTYSQSIVAYNQANADYQLSLWQLEQATGAPLRPAVNTVER